MQKMIKTSVVLLGIVFLAGCGQQPVSQIPSSPMTSGSMKCVDSDEGKNIYVKGSAETSENGTIIHISADSCATKSPSDDIYSQGIPLCTGDDGFDCYVMEGICKATNQATDGTMIDTQEAIKCPAGCDDGVCITRL